MEAPCPACGPTAWAASPIRTTAALQSLDMFENLAVGARVIHMQSSDPSCIADRIGQLANISLTSRIGIEPINRLIRYLEIPEEGIIAESHPHDTPGIRNLRPGDSTGADETGEMRRWIFGKHHLAHARPQAVR